MKKLIAFVIISMMIALPTFSQISITTDGSAPDPSSMLDVKSITKGLLIPRMTTAQRTAITSPAEGLMVYDTDLGGICFYRSGGWRESAAVTAGTGASNQVTFWSSTGVLSGNNNFYWDNSNSRLGIGTAGPNQQLEITASFRFPATTNATTGVIYKGGSRFIHDYKSASNNGSNTFMGVLAGNFTMIGPDPWDASYNTGIGTEVLYANESGSYNTGVGSNTLKFNTTGEANTALGSFSLYTNNTGIGNTAIGMSALYANSNGTYNTGCGTNALITNTSGGSNTALGAFVLYYNSTGSDNTAAGQSALTSNTTAGRNTALGKDALSTQSYDNGGTAWFSHNVAIGYSALSSNQPTLNTNGKGNTAVGSLALNTNVTGSNNTAVGYLANVSSGALSNTIAIGYNTIADASDQVRLGNSSILTLYCKGAWNTTSSEKPNMVVNSSGQIMQSTATIPSGSASTGQVTYWSGATLLAGNNNLFWDIANSRLGIGLTTPNQQLEITGAFRLPPTTTATTGVIYKGVDRFIHDYKPAGGLGGNMFVGINAGNFTMSGTGSEASYNTATGYLSLTSLTTGSDNTANGYKALTASTSGSANTATGEQSLNANTSGSHNVAIGKDALYYNVSGGYNTAAGKEAGRGTSGQSFSYNCLFGYQAGYSLSTGSQNILLGSSAGSTLTTGSFNIVIGYNQTVPNITAGNQMVIGTQNTLYGDLVNERIGLGTTAPGQKLEIKDGNLLLSNSSAAGEIRLAEPSAGGVNYTAIKAQSQATDLTFALPATAGASGNVLSTNGAGLLSWIAPTSADITQVGSMMSGIAFGDATADDDWLGLGAAAGRIEFDDQATDEVNILGANVGIGTATPGQQLEITKNFRLPATTTSPDTAGIIYSATNRFLHNFGSRNVFLGELSGNLTLAGAVNNTGIGDSTLYSLSSGDYNIAIGTSALKALTTATGNTVVGTRAAMDNQTGGYNTIVGYQAGSSNTVDRNTFIGCESGMNNTLGQYNVFMGHQSGYSNTTGNNSTAVGYLALRTQTGNGSNNSLNNTAVGFEAMYTTNPTSSSNGRDNVAVGYQAFRQNQTGIWNTSVGSGALYTSTIGTNNTAVGGFALHYATGNYNTGIGDGALESTSSGEYNTAVGGGALATTTTGSNNTGIGYNATCSGNSFANSTAIGYFASASSSNQVRLGNLDITTFYCMGAWNGVVGTDPRDLFVDANGKIGYVSSSARYKDNISDMEKVDWLYRLRPVNFTYKSDELMKKQYGLIAEEVEKVNSSFVNYNSDGSVETVSYSQLISPMIKAIQEQNNTIESLKIEISQVKAERDVLLKNQEAMMSRLEALEKAQEGLSER